MHLPQSLGLSDQKNICQQGYSSGQTRPTRALVPDPTQPQGESVPNKKLCLANFVSELRYGLALQKRNRDPIAPLIDTGNVNLG